MTDQATHTPGPWKTWGLWVCEENDPGHNVGICMMEERPEASANARLIAAAPELLACCKAAQIVLKNEAIVLTALNLAIAKAEGR